jgi:transmembrane sensor
MDASMTRKTATIEAAALEWTIRVQAPEFAEWDALSAWLAADPRHADCFHRLTLLDDEIASDVREIPPRQRPAAGGPQPGLPPWTLLAAGLALALVLGAVVTGRARLTAQAPSTRIAVTTRAGERRQLRLADGTEIVVAGGE